MSCRVDFLKKKWSQNKKLSVVGVFCIVFTWVEVENSGIMRAKCLIFLTFNFINNYKILGLKW